MTAFEEKRWFFTALLALFSACLCAQTAKYSNEFLNVGIGARSLGMGRAFVANAGDVTAAYWNPAGMVDLAGKHEASLMHAQYFAGIAKFDYMGAGSRPDERSALGLSVMRYGVDDIPNTTDLMDGEGNIDYDRISRFSVADYAVLLTYSRRTALDGLDLGGNAKIIRRVVGEFASAWGFGLDVAARYRHGGWLFGAVLRDATGTFNVWQFNEEELVIEVADSVFNLPPGNSLEVTVPRLHLGVAHNFVLSERITLLAEVNASFSFEGRTAAVFSGRLAGAEPVIGIEAGYGGLVFLRAGLGNVQRITEFGGNKRLLADPSAGIGLNLGSFYLDYAMSNISPQTIALYSNIFSVRYVFGAE